MRAGRLLNLLLALQEGHRVTAGELSRRLEVSERTVLRDLEVLSGSGVPVYAVRGPGGGFELLDTYRQEVPPPPPGLTTPTGQLRRVRVRLSPNALRLALVTGSPAGWRSRPQAAPALDRPDWIEGSFKFTSYDQAIGELVAFGHEVEILLPAELRERMAAVAQAMLVHHQ